MQAPEKTNSLWHRLYRALMRAIGAVPLFYRLLFVGSLASAGVVIFAVWVTSTHIALHTGGGAHWGIAIALIAAGLSVTLAINFAIMRMGFRPMESLAAAIEQVRRGHLSARARHYSMGDARIDRLVDAFNEMAASLEAQRAQLAQLSARVLAAQEEERGRIARELHDDAGQALTSLLLDLKALEKIDDADRIASELAHLRESASNTLEGVRRLARNLRPPVLDDLGLAAALSSLLSEASRTSGLQIEKEVTSIGDSLTKEAAVALYRVAQEALTNVAKHADARRVRVKLARDGDVVRLLVEDDGVGFDVEAALAGTTSSLGLFIMQDRLALVGGTLRVQSTPGRGTIVIGEVPVRRQQT